MRRRLAKIACLLSVTIFSTVSLSSFAAEDIYKIEQSAYLNATGGFVEASCHAGDSLVKSLCLDRLDAISVPWSERLPFPAVKDRETAVQDAHVKVETGAQSVRCQVEKLHADQRVRMIAVAHCKPSRS